MTDTRPIKFRAYVPEVGKILDAYGVNPMNSTCYLSHQQLFGRPGDDVLVPFDDYEDSNVKLMQFTGLLDKNGKEIYEGDIVDFYHLTGYDRKLRKTSRRVIEWDPTPTKVGYNFGLTKPENLEVVGNIYENKELIK